MVVRVVVLGYEREVRFRDCWAQMLRGGLEIDGIWIGNKQAKGPEMSPAKRQLQV